MKLRREISLDGRRWHAVDLYTVMPLVRGAKYIIAIRNLIILSFVDVASAKRHNRRIKSELAKLGTIMELAGYSLHVYAVRAVQGPDYERNSIDAKFEVVED